MFMTSHCSIYYMLVDVLYVLHCSFPLVNVYIYFRVLFYSDDVRVHQQEHLIGEPSQ